MKQKIRYSNFSDSDVEKLSSSNGSSGSGNSNGFWNSLFSNSGSILSGLGQGIASILGKEDSSLDSQNQYQSGSESSGTGFGTYFLIGGGALILILVLVLFMKK